jgi:uncharacterized membrane protein YbhN (UPF0104 family)
MASGPVDPAPARGLQRLKALLSVAVGLGLLAVSAWVLKRWVAEISLEELAAELAALSLAAIGVSILFTGLSFVALVGYEYYAVRYVRRRLQLPLIALYSFVTQSVAHAVGFAIVVGATIRYKLYAPSGFSLFEVAKIQVFFMTTFGLGASTLIGGVFLLEPGPLEAATAVPDLAWRLLGAMILACVAGFVVLGAYFRRPIRLFGEVLTLPGAKVTLIQIALGIADLLSVAASLHVLMPEELGLGYLETLGIFAAAVTVGLISHIPGSLGVFETTVILLIDPAPELAAPLIGALIAFRGVYYMLPLLLGATAFGAVELRRWLRPAGVRHPPRP